MTSAKQKTLTQCIEIQRAGQQLLSRTKSSRRELRLIEITDARVKRLFDEALSLVHYAGSCQRVGRCMRLGILFKNEWAGGIVLGSTFPNIDVRDRYVGLKPFVMNLKARGLKNAWVRENREYWDRLQKVVNHARTFVFPAFQGYGIATRGHRLLLKEGVKLWEQKYSDRVAALDTLCDHGDSKLFLSNGWTLVGETKGFCSNPKSTFTQKLDDKNPLKNNVALAHSPQNPKWVVWVKMIDSSVIQSGP